MASLLSTARLLGLLLPFSWMACGTGPVPPSAEPEVSVPPALPSGTRESSFRLERTNQGPYLEHTVERFQAIATRADVKDGVWSASGGVLETQGSRVTWTLPRAGTASLTFTARTASGQPLTETFQFRVSSEATSQVEGTQSAVTLAPVAVDTSGDDTGYLCDLAFDPAGNGHLIYYNSRHPSIWYGAWNGSTWSTQQVDGMGFNTGGVVLNRAISLAVDTAGNPHMVYAIEGKGIWYATLSGTTWVRERVSTAALPPEAQSLVSIALDPAQGNRPTVAYSWSYYDSSRGYTYRTVVAYRTGTNAWSTASITFPGTNASLEQSLRGEVLFDPSGTLYIPYGSLLSPQQLWGVGTWRPGTSPAALEFPYVDSGSGDASLARTASGHLLMTRAGVLLDITPSSPWSTSTSIASALDPSPSSLYAKHLVDLIFAAGKPQLVQFHGGSLELVSPNTSNYWTYTDVGSAKDAKRVSLAYRPTTGTVHYCFQSGTKVMFQ